MCVPDPLAAPHLAIHTVIFDNTRLWNSLIKRKCIDKLYSEQLNTSQDKVKCIDTCNNMDESQMYLEWVEEFLPNRVHTMRFHLYKTENQDSN